MFLNFPSQTFVLRKNSFLFFFENFSIPTNNISNVKATKVLQYKEDICLCFNDLLLLCYSKCKFFLSMLLNKLAIIGTIHES